MVADVIEAFKQQGFEFVGKTDDGWFKLHGSLVPPDAGEGFRVRFSLILRSWTCLASGCSKFLLSYLQRFLILGQMVSFVISTRELSSWTSTTLSGSHWHACSEHPSCLGKSRREK